MNFQGFTPIFNHLDKHQTEGNLIISQLSKLVEILTLELKNITEKYSEIEQLREKLVEAYDDGFQNGYDDGTSDGYDSCLKDIDDGYKSVNDLILENTKLNETINQVKEENKCLKYLIETKYQKESLYKKTI